MGEFFNLIKKMGIRKKYVFLLILRAPFDAFRTWMLAGLMKSVFLCLETGDTEGLSAACIIYGLICAALFFYNGVVWSIYAAFSAKVEVRLQKMMIKRILNLPLERVDSRFCGEWMTKLNSDIQAAFAMMNAPLNIPHAVVSVINTLLSSFLVLKTGFLLFVMTWAFFLPYLLINYGVVLRHIPKLKEASQKALAESTSAMKPLITEADTIRLYGAGDLMMETCAESSRKLMKINQSMHMRNALSSAILQLFGRGGYLAILMAGYGLVSGGMMSFSDVVYCLQVRGSVLAGMSMLITCLNNIKANSVCIKRIQDVFNNKCSVPFTFS